MWGSSLPNSSEEFDGKLVRRRGLENLLGSVRGSIKTHMRNAQSYRHAEGGLRSGGWCHDGENQAWKQEDE